MPLLENLNTSWMRELDICCVKDSELYLWNFMLTNKFLPFGEFEPGTFGSKRESLTTALSNQNIIVGSDMDLCDKLQNV